MMLLLARTLLGLAAQRIVIERAGLGGEKIPPNRPRGFACAIAIGYVFGRIGTTLIPDNSKLTVT
jgi:hypothetical protein